MNFSLQLMQLDNNDFKSLKMDDVSPKLKSIMMSLQGKHEEFLMKREHNSKGITEEDIENETDEFIESFGVLELSYDDIERYLDTNIDFGPFDDKKPINKESFDYYLNKMCLKTDGLVIYKGDTSNALDWSMFIGKYLNQLQPEYLDENFNEISREDFVRKSLKIKQELGYSLSSLICYIN